MQKRALTGMQTISLLERAWKAGFDVLMLTVDTWQLGWRPTDINIANYVYV
jgi:isopentenyl diphosphate isomerase/L-lactate dehydrogenase-like FMN-dependent dehydrogenase